MGRGVSDSRMETMKKRRKKKDSAQNVANFGLHGPQALQVTDFLSIYHVLRNVEPFSELGDEFFGGGECLERDHESFKEI